MQISLHWVDELVNIKSINVASLIEKLTLGGFEVEETFELDINNKTITILDISTTANRSDSLSVKGISKEIAALTNKSYKSANYLTKTLNWKNEIDQFASTQKFSTEYLTFIAIEAHNLLNSTPPKWLKEKLSSSGLIVSNNLLDFQRYILCETGYPFQFYDWDKIIMELESSNFTINLNIADQGEHFLAENNFIYDLNEKNLVIKADTVTLGIAGVIAHKNFAYSNKTKSLLIEGSIFNSKKIRQQSRTLGLRTDRSARYEKGLNNSDFVESFYRLLALLKVLNPTIVLKLHTINPLKTKIPEIIFLKYKNINEILGPILSKNTTNSNFINPLEISNYLQRLNFKYTFDDKKLVWEVQIPSSRATDLTREIDLIEEIGRLYGFNNFVTALPKLNRIGVEDYSYQIRKKLTSCFLSSSFNELIEYSLVTEKTSILNTVKLINPLVSDCSYLRSSLLPKLVENINENLKQNNLNLNGFEYGHVFSNNTVSTLTETEKIAGILGGSKIKTEWSGVSKSLSWFESKGKIEQIFNQLDLVVYWKISSNQMYHNLLHPHRTAELYLTDGRILGIFGQIHPIIAKKRQIASELYLFEFNFNILKTEFKTSKLVTYKPYSLYPKIVKDLSFILTQDISFETIKDTILTSKTEFLVDVKLLDEYRGDSIPIGSTSLCIQLSFQSDEKTLETIEIENIINKLQSILIDTYKIVIRT